MNADAHFLAEIPQRMPERIAEIFETLHRDARIRQNVNAPMAGLNGALHLADDRFDGAHVRHCGKRNEAVACPAKFGESIVIGPDAVKLELRVAVEESATGSVGKQNFAIDPVSIQRFKATRGIVDFER